MNLGVLSVALAEVPVNSRRLSAWGVSALLVSLGLVLIDFVMMERLSIASAIVILFATAAIISALLFLRSVTPASTRRPSGTDDSRHMWQVPLLGGVSKTRKLHLVHKFEVID